MKLAARIVAAIVLAALAAPADAAWKQLRRDASAMLSIDSDSIKREGDVASLRYLVDFRLAQGDSRLTYRSIVASAKVDCKARTMALLHTDAYARYGGQGIIVAKTKLTPRESEFKPLTSGTSDEDLWKFVCEGKAPAPPPKK